MINTLKENSSRYGQTRKWAYGGWARNFERGSRYERWRGEDETNDDWLGVGGMNTGDYRKTFRQNMAK